MDRGAWCAVVHGVAKSRTKLSHFTFTFHFHALEKEMATHSMVLAWRIPGTGEPGGVTQSWTGLKRLSSSSSSSSLTSLKIYVYMGFPGGSDGKESACNVGDWVQSLGQEDTLQECMTTHSRILAWRI